MYTPSRSSYDTRVYNKKCGVTYYIYTKLYITYMYTNIYTSYTSHLTLTVYTHALQYTHYIINSR